MCNTLGVKKNVCWPTVGVNVNLLTPTPISRSVIIACLNLPDAENFDVKSIIIEIQSLVTIIICDSRLNPKAKDKVSNLVIT